MFPDDDIKENLTERFENCNNFNQKVRTECS